jgi:hypothetical protein
VLTYTCLLSHLAPDCNALAHPTQVAFAVTNIVVMLMYKLVAHKVCVFVCVRTRERERERE